MTEKEQLWYLIDGLLQNEYDIVTFCDEFTRIYDLELDYDVLNSKEKEELGDLCDMAARFSEDIADVNSPGVYFDEHAIREKCSMLKIICRQNF